VYRDGGDPVHYVDVSHDARVAQLPDDPIRVLAARRARRSGCVSGGDVSGVLPAVRLRVARARGRMLPRVWGGVRTRASAGRTLRAGAVAGAARTADAAAGEYRVRPYGRLLSIHRGALVGEYLGSREDRGAARPDIALAAACATRGNHLRNCDGRSLAGCTGGAPAAAESAASGDSGGAGACERDASFAPGTAGVSAASCPRVALEPKKPGRVSDMATIPRLVRAKTTR